MPHQHGAVAAKNRAIAALALGGAPDNRRAVSDVRARSPYAIEAAALRASAAQLLPLWAMPDSLGERAAAKLDWAYVRNPAGEGEALLLRPADGDAPVGTLALHRRLLWQGQASAAAAVMADFVIDPGHRTLGPALMLMRQACARAREQGLLLYGMPNARSLAVSRRAGLAVSTHLVRRGKLLRSRWLSGRLGLRRRPPGLGRAVDSLLALWDALLDRARGARWRPCAPGGPQADPALAALWQARPAHLWLADRSPAVLAWRFALGDDAAAGIPAPPASIAPLAVPKARRSSAGPTPWQLSVLEHPPGHALGWVVWRQSDDVVELGDCFCPDPEERLPALLLSFARWARRERQASALTLELAAPKALDARLRLSGFVSHEVGDPVIAAADGLPAGWGATVLMTTFDRDPDV